MGQTSSLHLLLTKGCHWNLRDNWGYTPLMLACKSGHIETVTYLTEIVNDFTCRANNGDTLLHCIAYSGSIILTRLLLLNAPILLNKCNDNEETICDICKEKGFTDLLNYLLDLGGSYGEELTPEETIEQREKRKILEKRIDQEKRDKDEMDAKNGIKCKKLSTE